jgi:hypothetical protein
MEQMTLVIAAGFALVLLTRVAPGLFSPVLAFAAQGRPVVPSVPDDDEEQLPETDRAPRNWLPWSVAAVAAVRLVLLLTLHA